MSAKRRQPAQRGVDPDVVEEIAQRIYRARSAGVQTEMLPESLYPIWDEIYPVHDRVHELMGHRAVGWKVGAASVEVQEAEGMPEPVAGRIYERGLHDSPAVLGPELFIGFRLCESEFVLVLGEDLPDGREPLAANVVEAAVDGFIPGLEVGDMVFPDWYGTNPFWGACLDNAGGSQLVLGETIAYEPSIDLANARMTMRRNGDVVREGTGAAAMGDPLLSATWVVNLRRRAGDRITAGTLLSTGTCTGHFFASSDDEVVVDFGAYGAVSARFARDG